MDQEKAKFDIFTNKISLILLFILGFFISVFGVGTFALYFILNTLGFSYALLVMTAFALALMIIYKEKNKLILSSIILLGISIILQLAFIFSRDYVLSFFTSTIAAASGILNSIVIAILYKNNFHKNESKKCKISSSTVSKITTIVIAIICIICTVILHTFAINAMYYSSLPVGFAKEYKDVSYGPYGIRNTMTIYVPKSALAREENAAMIYLHPGGWNAGDKNLCSSDARRAAKQGYITMFMNYRFLNDSNDFDMDDLLDDITLALNEFKKYSDKNGWNVTKISLNGYSAGAHLSMLYGYKCKDKSPFEISYIAAKAGVFIFNEPSYYPPDIVYTGGVFGGGLHDSPLRNDANGKKLSHKDVIYKPEVLQKLKEISPAYYMSDDNPPLLQCYANADDIISFKQVADIEELLTLKPFENEIIVCDGCSHLFLENHKELKAYYNRVNEWAKHFFGY
ncbi:MAG: hypothetical protein ACOX24_06020 [Christensenellales bacterium]|jgi:acetyl esterase/lipase|nr:alpha/beta hydrolase fold domain-containing protein [Clostridiales bacterium]